MPTALQGEVGCSDDAWAHIRPVIGTGRVMAVVAAANKAESVEQFFIVSR